jgi:hypothetical protein
MIVTLDKTEKKQKALLKAKVSRGRLENDPRFLKRVEQARESLRVGRGVRLENLKVGR